MGFPNFARKCQIILFIFSEKLKKLRYFRETGDYSKFISFEYVFEKLVENSVPSNHGEFSHRSENNQSNRRIMR